MNKLVGGICGGLRLYRKLSAGAKPFRQESGVKATQVTDIIKTTRGLYITSYKLICIISRLRKPSCLKQQHHAAHGYAPLLRVLRKKTQSLITSVLCRTSFQRVFLALVCLKATLTSLLVLQRRKSRKELSRIMERQTLVKSLLSISTGESPKKPSRATVFFLPATRGSSVQAV